MVQTGGIVVDLNQTYYGSLALHGADPFDEGWL
jgi:hypothetical protein